MTTPNSPLNQIVWDKWLKDKDSEAGNLLVQHYMYLVNFHVDRMAYTLPSSINKDDLQSFALMGLLDAINKFEPKRNLKFDTYASFRIRGSIIDGLRKEDWLPRTLREKSKQIEQVTEELEQLLQRPPSSSEIARKLDITPEEVETIIQDSLFANILSIEQKPKDSSNELKDGIGYTVPDEKVTLPDEHIFQMELRKELSQSIKLLNENEQLIISLFYHDELTMTEIGEVVGLTTSRISQIHKRALFKLKKSLEKLQYRS